MAGFSTRSLQLFARQHGVASVDDLVAAGLSPHTIRHLVAIGNLEPLVRGTYRLPAVPLDELGRCAAVCAAHPEAVIAGPTAGRLWGFRRLPRDHRIHVIVPPGSQPTIVPWVVPYRTAAIHPVDIIRRPDGIAVTDRPRTALDLMRHLSPSDLLSVIEQAMHDGRHSADDMCSAAIDWISRGRPFVRRYLEVLVGRVDGGAAESHFEVVLGAALAGAGVRGLERQLAIELPVYGSARFDLAIPARRLAIEVDVFPTHRETAGRAQDALRDDAAISIGWAVERVDETGFGAALDSTVERIRRVADERAAR